MKNLDFSSLPKIIAVDFDGTLVTDAWPEIGEPNTKLVSELKALQKDFGVKLILWTCRNNALERSMLNEALNFCTKHLNLKFDAVNDNIKEAISLTGQNTRKIYADLYIDDKSIPHNQDMLYWLDSLGLNYIEVKDKIDYGS